MRRGEVFALRRGIGFGSRGAERFVVLQADRISAALDTVLAAPLDDALQIYATFGGAVPVGASEAGTRADQVVVVTQLSCVAIDYFEPMPVGKVKPATLARVNRVLRLVLHLS